MRAHITLRLCMSLVCHNFSLFCLFLVFNFAFCGPFQKCVTETSNSIVYSVLEEENAYNETINSKCNRPLGKPGYRLKLNKGEVFPVYATKGYKGSRGIAPLIPEVIVPLL